MQTIATIAPSCPPLLQEPLDADSAVQLAGALKAIADPARLRLLSLIQAQPAHEACVCHLTEPLGLSQPTVSHHLKVLLQAGLVEREVTFSGPDGQRLAGVELELTLPDSYKVFRTTCFFGDRSYTLAAAGPALDPALNAAAFRRFVDSFRLTAAK